VKSSLRLERLVADVRACQLCAPHFASHEPRPVLFPSTTAKICIVGQAPGTRVHETGLPFNDRSGDRLRDWLKVDRDTFYDNRRIAIVPMGFCFPGQDAAGGDLPPRPECAKTWRNDLFALMGQLEVYLLVGFYAQRWHLGDRVKASLTETVKAWRDYRPTYIPLPHPSWRNTGWLKKNLWFEEELVPYLRRAVHKRL
jgi:uracil-DNA glycosylase